ncbi:glycosyltransferase family A protein [Azotobacter beijerinckii]|uniref:Glycosyl transferase family 2 n=1 Tax=Azotobacter beijerinckii TaxID=170623 RepID=A0A1I4BLN4_9GAMM|nr:glycosyltransferase family A protein [Azotobacter beijerinckii]SFB11002.1 Glycosyl transferase family 2 [Azotobacter beijerinckii]SFK69635.1 Glycosyl transferase family 2 [Azotobacter beijerinckii]
MSKITINITTTYNRLELCSQTLWSLLNQSALPEKIVVWVSKEAYLIDKGIDREPYWVRDLNKIKNMIEFKWTTNTGPYRKLFPALAAASEDQIIVYADDDTIYKENWLNLLISKFQEHNEEKIVASRVRISKRNLFGRHKSYMLWPISKKEVELDSDYLITGVGGVILKKKHIKEDFLTNQDYLKVCPKSDDFWISEIIARSRTPVLSCPEAMRELLFIKHEHGLEKQNTLTSSSLAGKLLDSIKINTLGRLGISVCHNDVSFKKIKSYFEAVDRASL